VTPQRGPRRHVHTERRPDLEPPEGDVQVWIAHLSGVTSAPPKVRHILPPAISLTFIAPPYHYSRAVQRPAEEAPALLEELRLLQRAPRRWQMHLARLIDAGAYSQALEVAESLIQEALS